MNINNIVCRTTMQPCAITRHENMPPCATRAYSPMRHATCDTTSRANAITLHHTPRAMLNALLRHTNTPLLTNATLNATTHHYATKIHYYTPCLTLNAPCNMRNVTTTQRAITCHARRSTRYYAPHAMPLRQRATMCHHTTICATPLRDTRYYVITPLKYKTR